MPAMNHEQMEIQRRIRDITEPLREEIKELREEMEQRTETLLNAIRELSRGNKIEI